MAPDVTGTESLQIPEMNFMMRPFGDCNRPDRQRVWFQVTPAPRLGKTFA
jgi:hypothetical protein